MQKITLEQLEALERNDKLHDKPALQARLAELRRESDVQREFEELSKPTIARNAEQSVGLTASSEGIGLIHMGVTEAFPLFTNSSGEAVRYHLASALCFMPQEAWDHFRSLNLPWLDGAIQGHQYNGALIATFDRSELNGNLWNLIAGALDPWAGGNNADVSIVDRLWRRIVRETSAHEQLHAWYRAAARDASQNQLQMLKSHMVANCVPIPLVRESANVRIDRTAPSVA